MSAGNAPQLSSIFSALHVIYSIYQCDTIYSIKEKQLIRGRLAMNEWMPWSDFFRGYVWLKREGSRQS